MLSVVDLFAGCGGLSLGLELAGFTPTLAAELNDSARKTYAVNREHLKINVVSDVSELARLPRSELRALAGLTGGARPTLVAGGPPCQGFSGIGHRRTHTDVERHEISSNHLYRDMVEVIDKLHPDAFLFENVRGILSAKWSRDSDDGVWDTVRGYFVRVLQDRYVIAFQLVHGYDYGVPQNRPRVLMLGLRRECWRDENHTLTPDEINATTREGRGVAIEVGLLPAPLVPRKRLLPDLVDLLGDLVDENLEIVTETSGPRVSDMYPARAVGVWQQAMRARYAQSKTGLEKGAPLLEQEYSRHSRDVVKRFKLILAQKEIPAFLKTKKFAQRPLPRRWGAGLPHITVASLPDDFVHFSQPRSMTVREWARMQGFPDWYKFEGPRTTGGHRRTGDVRSKNSTRETPKYTQIGNAVPVPLAAALGWHLRSLLGISPSESMGLERTILGRLLKEHFETPRGRQETQGSFALR